MKGETIAIVCSSILLGLTVLFLLVEIRATILEDSKEKTKRKKTKKRKK